MSTFIYTGSKKCKVMNLMECPICGDEFETSEGVFVASATIGDEVYICTNHKKVLTSADEVAIQNALQAAINSPRGHIMADGKLVKKYKAYKEDAYTKLLKL